MTDRVLCTFQWNFGKNEVGLREFAEAELLSVEGREQRLLLRVHLVRDEMQYARALSRGDFKGKRRPMIDPDMREGARIYVTTLRDGSAFEDDRDDAADLRALAYMAPIEGDRKAYTVIFNALLTAPDKVEKYGNDWLTALVHDALARQDATLV